MHGLPSVPSRLRSAGKLGLALGLGLAVAAYLRSAVPGAGAVGALLSRPLAGAKWASPELRAPAVRLSEEGSASRRAVLLGATAATAAPVASLADGTAMREDNRQAQVTYRGETVTVPLQRLTGAGDPSWSYPQKDITKRVLEKPFPAEWPFTPEDFGRMDEGPDLAFYPPSQPKLVYHIDEGAVSSLTHYYAAAIPAGSDVLDICSSWVSHYPRGTAGLPDFAKTMKSITGTGINELELSLNDQFSSYSQADLNASPKLPFPDASFDAVTCVVSFDYLTKPREVMREVARVLRPGGRVIISQSNRCFFTKAVRVWTDDMRDDSHLEYLATLVHFAGGFGAPRVLDITARGGLAEVVMGQVLGGLRDPMYIVEAQKI